jgi:putative phosphoribosyl transferase
MPHPLATNRLGEVCRIPVAGGAIEGNLTVPQPAHGVILFAHGSGSSRFSPRNQFVARTLQDAGLATLLVDLLTEQEERIDMTTAHLRFDIGFLASRLVQATDWLLNNPRTGGLSIGYFGASTGAAAALVAATRRPRIAAVVSRGGRPDLAGDALEQATAPTLLIVGGHDYGVIELNEEAYARLHRARKKELHIVPGATHLFEERGALEEVARLATEWFTKYVGGAAAGEV